MPFPLTMTSLNKLNLFAPPPMRVDNHTYGLSLLAFLGFFILLAVLHGCYAHPYIGQLYWVSLDIFSQQILGERHWLEQSFLYPVLAYLTTANRSLEAYCLLSGLLLFVQLILVHHVVFRYAKRNRTLILAFIATSGMSTSLLYWVGYTDATMLLFSSALIFMSQCHTRREKFALLMLGFFAGLAHQQQGVVLAFMTLFLIPGVRHRSAYQYTVLGLLIGMCLLRWYFIIFGFRGIGRYDYIQHGLVSDWAIRIPDMLGAYLTSVFAGSWYLLGWATYQLRKHIELALNLVICLIIAFAIGTISLDSTRVTCVMLYPIIMRLFVCIPSATLGRLLFLLATGISLKLLMPTWQVMDFMLVSKQSGYDISAMFQQFLLHLIG